MVLNLVEVTDMFNLIDIGSYVAIRSAPGSFELFHLMKVTEKGIAEGNMMDSSKDHCVLKGEPYLLGTWISFLKDTKKYTLQRI